MSDDVSIPADAAVEIAQYHRSRARAVDQYDGTEQSSQWHAKVADLLSPPQTLHEKVYEALISSPRTAEERTKVILAIVRDDLLSNWLDYADANCWPHEMGMTGYAVDTRTVPDYIKQRLDGAV